MQAVSKTYCPTPPSYSTLQVGHATNSLLGPDSLSGDPDGYPQLAEDSMVRRFGWLHRRLLLYRHYELQSLEAELRDLDEQTENQEFQGDSRGTRPYLARDSLLEAINSQLSAYGESNTND